MHTHVDIHYVPHVFGLAVQTVDAHGRNQLAQNYFYFYVHVDLFSLRFEKVCPPTPWMLEAVKLTCACKSDF